MYKLLVYELVTYSNVRRWQMWFRGRAHHYHFCSMSHIVGPHLLRILCRLHVYVSVSTVIVCTLRIYTMHATDVYSAAFVPPPQLFIAIALTIYRIPFIFCFFDFYFLLFRFYFTVAAVSRQSSPSNEILKKAKTSFLIHFSCEDYIKVSI